MNSKKKAQSLIEYALILAMVAVVAIAALQLLGNNIGGTLRNAADVVGDGAANAGQNACEAMNAGGRGDGVFEWNAEANTCQFREGAGAGGGAAE